MLHYLSVILRIVFHYIAFKHVLNSSKCHLKQQALPLIYQHEVKIVIFELLYLQHYLCRNNDFLMLAMRAKCHLSCFENLI